MPKLKEKKSPVWRGPETDGITQSLLGDYLVCKERFRIKTIEGLRPVDQFNHRIEYGNMIHLCEEIYLLSDPKKDWRAHLLSYCRELVGKYKTQQEQVEKWYQVCLLQFPIYQEYWRKKNKRDNQVPILQEEKFRVQYELPSGRHVNLRGKWDGVNLIGGKRNSGLYLQENKTKGDIKEDQITRQVSFDLQTMTYLVALREHIANNGFAGTEAEGKKIKGIIYNVIRRPLSGGKGSIRPLKATKTKPAETLPAYYERLREVIIEDIDTYFMRWMIEITQQDIERFEQQTLAPLLENLCDDYEWWNDCLKSGFSHFDFVEREVRFGHRHINRHYRMPFGVYSNLLEGTTHDLDEYLMTGSTVGLEKTKTLFPEL